MGQCPMMPEPCYQEDENTGIIANGFACSGGSKDDDKQFLVPHRPDLAMRCILDPTDVYEIILVQAEILSRRAELMYRQEPENMETTESNSVGEAASEENCAMSTFAPSVYTEGGRTEVTTFSVATRVVGNYDKYSQPKRKYNRPKPPKRDLNPRRTNSKDLDRVMDSISENDTVVSSVPMTSTDTATKWTSPSSAPGCVSKSNQAIKSLLAPCIGAKLATKQARFSKEEFYNVLQLKMKLNLADYYQNEYLAMFPNSPTPAGMASNISTPSKRETAPQLTPISSDASSRSSATPGVAFGSGVSSSPIRLLADDSSFLDLAITGSLGLVNRGSGKGNSLSGSPSKQKSPLHYTVLINRRSGVPLAVCALKSHHGPPVVRIYATKQRVVGQRPAASTGDLGLTWTDSFPLFAWAEFTTEGEFPMPTQYSLYMASGSDGRFEKEPSYRASHQRTGSPDISMIGRTQTETEYKGCALLSFVSDENNDDEPFLSLSISRGIDPALLICFAAIVDETMEKTMRLHCELSTKKALRRERSKQSTTPLRMRSVWDKNAEA